MRNSFLWSITLAALLLLPFASVTAQEATPSPDETFNEVVRLNNLGLEADTQGRYDDALNYFHEALNLAREINERQGEGAILNNIGLVYDNQRQYSAALDYFEQALAIHREVGDRAGEGATLNNHWLVVSYSRAI